MGGDSSGGCDPVAKPAELVAMAGACAGLFARLRRWFDIGDDLHADLSCITSPEVVAELHDPQLVTAFAMRRLQALHHLAQPGVRTTVDVVIHNVEAVLRALVESPGRHLTLLADDVDWDRAWATLDAGMLLPEGCPEADAAAHHTDIGSLLAARAAVTRIARDAGTKTLVLT